MDRNEEKDSNMSVSQEYNFFEEHVRKKKKSKFKKRLVQILFTLLCAVIFGLVSSYIIIVSDTWFEKYLGIKEKQQIDVSRIDRNVGTPVVTNSLEITLDKPTSTPTPKSTPKPTPTALTKNDSVEDNNGESTDEHIDNSQTTDSGKNDESGNIVISDSSETTKSDANSESSDSSQADLSQSDEDTVSGDDYLEEEDKDAYTKDALERAYEIIKKAERDSKKSIVTVSNIHEEVVYLPSYTKITNKKDYFGVNLYKTTNSILILTKYSNVKASNRIEVDFGTGNAVAADLYSYDEFLDLCVVEVLVSRLSKEQLEHVTVAELTTTEVNKYTVGSLAIAHEKQAGFKDMSFEGTITSIGNVKEIKDRVIDFFTLNTINYAKAEGFVFNLDGELLGIIDHSLEDDSHQITTIMSFDSMRWALSKLLSGGKIPGLGVTVSDMTDLLKQKTNAKNGVFIKEVDKNSNSFDFLAAGDILVAINSLELSDVHAYAEIMSRFNIGDTVTVTVLKEKLPGEYREEEYEIVVQ